MKMIIKNQTSNLSNQDIKWYLSDEKLWITKYCKYEDVEESIGKSIGSFNWLYEINDTLLFNKVDGKFETAIIDLSGKIITADITNIKDIKDIVDIKDVKDIIGIANSIDIADVKEFVLTNQIEKRKELYLKEKKNFNFEFSPMVIYIKEFDYLLSFPVNRNKQDFNIAFIVSDFGERVNIGELHTPIGSICMVINNQTEAIEWIDFGYGHFTSYEDNPNGILAEHIELFFSKLIS